jgi:hypothetical protein
MSEPLDARGTTTGKITLREHSMRKNLVTSAEKEILRLGAENRALRLRVARLQAAMRRAANVLGMCGWKNKGPS